MWKEKLKKQWNEHPLECIIVISLAITATAKLVDSMSAAQGRRAYAKQINHKVNGK